MINPNSICPRERPTYPSPQPPLPPSLRPLRFPLRYAPGVCDTPPPIRPLRSASGMLREGVGGSATSLRPLAPPSLRFGGAMRGAGDCFAIHPLRGLRHFLRVCIMIVALEETKMEPSPAFGGVSTSLRGWCAKGINGSGNTRRKVPFCPTPAPCAPFEGRWIPKNKNGTVLAASLR